MFLRLFGILVVHTISKPALSSLPMPTDTYISTYSDLGFLSWSVVIRVSHAFLPLGTASIGLHSTNNAKWKDDAFPSAHSGVGASRSSCSQDRSVEY
ncbi:hypothetical protein CYLTODRAFT_222949 [Cylindrobasidium torrendii FP15055 ss-10]|uniref:Secreted protein n=1 Tax=Cylindrobasidium torrendii FP15055 ss-10 TaxID=1314674 RepID=A0A0D7ATZ1_9AGAR|nr:hypothetical protein CYLTODRAFT_222949 [Cylindrobasidium torrendii FP15055 ss-10]